MIPLEAEPTAHYLTEGKGETAECPGTAEKPEAAPGRLCVYAQYEIDAPTTIDVTGHPYGAIIGGSVGGEPGGIAAGSWAVTAE